MACLKQLRICLMGLLVVAPATIAAEQPRVLAGILLDDSQQPAIPVDQATVTLISTGQQAVTRRGRFQFTLPAALVPGSEVILDVKAGNLRVYLPHNGVLAIPAPGAKPVQIEMMPAGSKVLLHSPGAIEALLAQAAKPPPGVTERRTANRPAEQEPRLERFLKQWALEYGFGLADVQREVQAWAEEIRSNRETSSVRQQALAEFEAQRFERAATLFERSATSESEVLDQLETERKKRDIEERTVLRRYLDDNIRASQANSERFEFERAAHILESAAIRVDRSRYPEWWAEMQQRRGEALEEAGALGGAAQSIASLRAAESADKDSLEVYTKEAFPNAWATSQNNLGNVYIRLSERLTGAAVAESLRSALAAYENALTVRTRALSPEDWAKTENNLGMAYLDLGAHLSGKEAYDNLHAAIGAFRSTLGVITRENAPQEWALVQNNVGLAYERLGEHMRFIGFNVNEEERANDLRTAVGAFRSALEVLTQGTRPRNWAEAQSNLGTVSVDLASHLKEAEATQILRDAVAALNNALQVFTKETLPQEWANAESSLGLAYLSLAEHQSGAEAVKSLQAAVSAHQNALAVFTKQSLPRGWAETQNNLGRAYTGLGKQLKDDEGMDALRRAVAAFQNALQVFTRESLPQDWGVTQTNLGTAWGLISDRLKGTQATEAAISGILALQNALEVMFGNENAHEAGVIQGLVAVATSAGQLESAKSKAAADNFRTALVTVEKSLELYPKESNPTAWAIIEDVVGAAWVRLRELAGEANAPDALPKALEAFGRALSVLDRKKDSDKWVPTEYLILRVYRMQQRWKDVAQAFDEILAIMPRWPQGISEALNLYHDRLFDFDRSLELATRQAQLGKGQAELVESQFTAARFADCATNAAAIDEKLPDAGQRIVVHAFRFACLAGAGKTDEAHQAGLLLKREVTGLKQVSWSFTGTEYFLNHHPKFAASAAEWIRLFDAFTQGDERKAVSSLTVLVPE